MQLTDVKEPCKKLNCHVTSDKFELQNATKYNFL